MKTRLAEVEVSDRRLGRNINHDPRSLSYLVEPATADQSVVWERHISILDQGNLGSCTGNAETGLLGSSPFYETLGNLTVLDQAFAVALYSLATHIDPYDGEYEPNDTGSDGLSINKAAQQKGLISGYQHAVNLSQALGLIQKGPFIIGTNWTSNLDEPDAEGIVHNPSSGQIRGGHEYVCRERDAARGLWWFDNSWGESFGLKGRFAYDDAGLTLLMGQGGDMTQSVPLTEPSPEPTPPTADPDVLAWWAQVKPWATGHFMTKLTKAHMAAEASLKLAHTKGLR